MAKNLGRYAWGKAQVPLWPSRVYRFAAGCLGSSTSCVLSKGHAAFLSSKGVAQE